MNSTHLDFAPVLQRLLAPFVGHPLLERLFFGSLELAVLALLVFAAIRIGRIRSPRLTALLWLLVLGKPLVSLAIGSPFHLFRMEVPAAVVAAPALLAPAADTDPQPSFTTSSSSSIDVQSPPEPIVVDEEMAGAPFSPLPEKATPTPATPPVTPTATVPAPPARTSPPWSPATWILGFWLTGVAFFAGLSLVDRARAWRLVRAARKPEPSLSDRYVALAAAMGLKRPAALKITDEMESPALVGSIFSTIVIPGWLAEDANQAKLDWALRHELMHFRLRDPWAALVRELSQMFFYFHPVAWWVGAKWKTATEKACDRAIVADEAAARDYAEQLYRILVGIHGRRQAALRTGLFATRTQIGQRIAALLYGPRTAPHLNALALVAVALVTAVTLSVGGAFADKNSKPEESKKTPSIAAADQTPTQNRAAIDSSAASRPSGPEKLKTADETFTYAGTVVDENGKPVAGAKISVAYWSANQSPVDPPTLATSDAQGRFRFSRHGSDFSDAMAADAWASAALFATKDGSGFAGGRCIDFETTRSRGDLDLQRRMEFKYLGESKGNVLRLVRDDFPIDGQILDSEGQPVAGALVETINVWQPGNGSLDAWEAAAKQHRHLEDWSPGALRPLVLAYELTGPRSHVIPAVRTDATGTFTLTGLGHERIADLVVSAPGIESIVLRVRSRGGDRIKLPRVWLDPREPTEVLFYPCDFRCVAGPSVPIEGRVIDAKSGQPLAGLAVTSESAGSVFNPAETTTDADGHYWLLGSAIGQQDLVAMPPPGSPYFPGGARLTTAVRQKPAVADIRLSAGVLVQGRVTEHGSGKPISGHIRYFALRANPHLGELAHALSHYLDASELQRVGDVQGRIRFVGTRCCRVDKSGIFSVPVVPGKGILAFGADNSHAFPWGIGADRIDGAHKGTRNNVSFDTVPFGCNSSNYNLLTAINVEEGAELRKLDLTLVSALTLQGRLRAPDGRVLSNYSIYAQRIPPGGDASWFAHWGDTFEIQVYPPDAPRRLMFYQPQSNLVGWYDFTGEPTGPLDITLKPAGRLTGRVVDKDGQPMGDVSLVITPREAVARGKRDVDSGEAAAATERQFDQSQIMVDKAGRFELRGVFPGVAYSASLRRGPIFTNMTAQIGETKDLGDLRIGAAVKAATEPAKAKAEQSQMNAARGREAEPVAFADGRRSGPETAATAEVTFTYAGTVVDDHGKPVVGAEISLDYWHASDSVRSVPTLAVTDSKGRFEFSRHKREFAGADRSGRWWFPAMIVATKPGYGPAGGQSIEFETTGRLAAEQHQPPGWRPNGWSNVLKLASDDVPIRGRILDTEGRPVVGALVQALNLWEGRDGSLDTWEAATRRPGADLNGLEEKLRPINLSNRLTAPYPTLAPAVRTDANGWFTLAGLGRERLADLAVSAPGIETLPLHVRTRRGAVIKVLPDRRNPKSGQETFYPCDFTRVAGPSVTVEGQVTDSRSHQPLAGIRVHAARIISWPFRDDDLARRLISATTDAGGHYRLEGLPPGFARLGVIPPPGSRYLMAGVDVRIGMQRSPLAVDIKLGAGVMVHGRVTDSRTGMPAQGSLQYFAFWTNPHLKEAPGFGISGFIVPQSICNYRCAADGRFEIPVLPGPGILAFRADRGSQFPGAVGAADIHGPKGQSGAEFSTAPYDCRIDFFHLLTPLNPQPGTDSLALDLTLHSPAIVTGTVHGPDGKPLDDYSLSDKSSFLEEASRWGRQKGARFEIAVHSPTDHHRLMFYHRSRNLVGFHEFTGEPGGPLHINLQPGATLQGRLVDDGGQPLEEVSLVISARQAIARENRAAESREAAAATGPQLDQSQITTDNDGRFELRGVVPGLAYSAVAQGAITSRAGHRIPGGAVFTNIFARTGETKDLGDLRIAAADTKSAAASPTRQDKAEVKTIRGRVLLPDGRPAVSAKLSLLRFHWKGRGVMPWERVASTAANETGDFTIAVRPPDDSQDGLGLLVATAPGYGTECVQCGERQVSHPIEVKLLPDQPVRGRIVDLEGKPVAGARVRVEAIYDSLHGDLGPWLAAMKAGVRRYSTAAHALLGTYRSGFFAEGGVTTTDGDGRFTLAGLGAERVVDLAVESDRTAYVVITVATRHMQSITRPVYPNNAGGVEIFGAEFTKSARPTRPVVGVVRDKQTKQPLAGVSVESWHLAGEYFDGQRDIKTKTDAQGRYRLLGMPKGEGNALFVVPNDEQPYFMRNVAVPDSAGMEPVSVEIELDRGLWITGRVTDKETGQPVVSRINYWPFLDNSFTQGLPEFGPGNNMQGDDARFRTREDGSFRVPGLPGHGLVGAEAMRENYRRGAGAIEIGGLDRDNRLRTFRTPGGWPSTKYPTTMKEVNPAQGTENVVCNLVCDHGETVRITVLDPAGQPVNNCSLSLPLRTKEGKSRGINSPFEVNNLSLDQHQPLVIEQPQRKLGKFLVFTLKKDSPHSLTVHLEPTMTVTGRLVDEDGVPLSGISVEPYLRRQGDFSPQFPAIVCGPDGRFEYTGLPSGANVEFRAIGTAVEFLQFFGRMDVKPGKRVDLGDIKLKSRKSAKPAVTKSDVRENPPPSKAKDVAEVNEVHGRVVLPDGKPAAGAKVVALRRYWVENVKRTPIAKTIAGPDGAFTIAIPQNTPDDDVGTAAGLAWIGAEAEGFGTGYEVWRKRDSTPKELVIKLLPEVPIHGRIVDLEGKPVAGAHVSVNWQATPRQEFGSWLESLRAGGLAEFNRLAAGSELQGYEDDSNSPIVIDHEGRFALRGIGADRVARLAVRGDLIADASIDVVTRPIKAFPRQTGGDGTAQVFGPEFTFQAAPMRLIVGTVRDGATGMPLGGMSIRQLHGSVHTETDPQGKYRLVGLPKLRPGRGWRSRYELSILPNPDQPYPALKELEIPYSAGLDPITLDIKLPRGVWITGRVTEKETGAPAMSAVWYFPALSNPLLKEFPQLDGRGSLPRPLCNTAPDGTFRVVGLPGRGVVAVRGIHKIFVGGVEASRFAELAKNYPKGFRNQGFNISAIQEVEPAQGAANVTCDLVVSAGGTMHVLLADREGKPVSPCPFVYNMARRGLMHSRADQSPFELTAFESDESRPILFQCAKYRIGKALVIHYDEKSLHSTTVTLEPWTTVKGRIVDADGVPKKGEHVEIHAKIGKNGFLPAGSIDCDADGQFVCDSVAPGADSYAISASGFRDIATFAAVAGKTIDLGDIKPKRDEVTVSASKPDAAPKPAASPAKPAVADVRVIHGRVLLPDGKPAAGAKVFALRRYWSARVRRIPLDKTTADANGTFVVRIPKDQRYDGLGSSGGFAIIAAQADGFGPDWQQRLPSTGAVKEVVLKLVADSAIQGRIVDLEGKPVRGVQVKLLWLDTPGQAVADWLAAVKSGDDAFRNMGIGRELPASDDESQPLAVTDNVGRFTIKGMGADRVARLELRGETVAYAELDVVTRTMQPIRHHDPFGASGQLFGSDFTYQAAPTQPLVGTVRDAASGAPLAGVSIESRVLAGVLRDAAGALRTRTDAQGRYRLVGLQRGNGGINGGNIIAVVPNDEQPYFMLNWVQVPKAQGLAPATLDFKLTRGLWITGRAIDKATGKPVPCSLKYAPFLSNSLAANLPEFKRPGGHISDLTRYMARPDGTFRIVGLPGRGLVTAKAIGWSYRADAGAKVAGMSKDGNYPTYLRVETQGADVAEEINPAPGTESVTRDLVFDPGRTVRLSLVDAGGKPVGRCVYVFSRFRGGESMGQSDDGTIEMTGMASHESRPLLINAPERHLGKVLLLHEDEKSPQVQTVTLEPCATVKGRLVDEDGMPIKKANLSASARGGDGYSLSEPGKPWLDADGKFQLTDLPPGCEFYSIHVTRIGVPFRFETIADKVVVSAGKTIDLGEIKLKREK